MDGSDCVHVSIDVYLFTCVYECTFVLLFNTCSTHRIISLNWFENFPFIWKMKTSLPQFRLLPTVTRENKKTHTERKKKLESPLFKSTVMGLLLCCSNVRESTFQKFD